MSEPNICKTLPSRRNPPTALPLKLRVVGTARDGQTIELPATRSTIGAASNCTLRLRAPGVRPLHCLILRRPDGAVARSLSTDTLLNGAQFREQSLRPGDRLRFGPIEFEVLAGDESEIFSPASDPRNSSAHKTPEYVPGWLEPSEPSDLRAADLFERLDRLENRLQQSDELRQAAIEAQAADTASQVLSAREHELAATTALLEEERARYQSQLAELHIQLQAAQELLASKTQQWHELCERSQQESQRLRCELDSQLADITDKSQQFRDDLEALRSELHHERQNFESARQAWIADCQSLEEQRRNLAQANLELERLSFAAQQAFNDERDQWTNDRAELETSIAALQARCDGLEAEVQRHIERCQRLESQIDELQAVRREECTLKPQSTIEAIAQTDVGMPSGWSPPSDELAARKAIGGGRSELTWLAQQFATQPGNDSPPETENYHSSDSESSDSASEPELNRFERPLRSEEPVDADEYDHAPRTSWAPSQDDEGRSSDLESQYESPRSGGPEFSVRFLANWQPPLEIANEPAHDAASHRPLERLPAASEEVAGDALAVENYDRVGDLPTAAEAGPEDKSVFQRLERAGIWRDPASDLDVSAPAECADHDAYQSHGLVAVPDEGYAQDLPSDDMSCELAPCEPQAYDSQPAREAENDDSIESYMERLLQRVRRGDGESPSDMRPPQMPAMSIEDRPPQTEIELEPAPEAKSSESPKLAPEEYIPRSQAPELSADLTAMRALANDSRHRSMRSHAERTWTSESGGKLLCAVAGFSVSLACYFLYELQPMIAGAGVVGGIAVGGVCVWQAFSLRRKLFDSLKLDTEYLNNDSEPADVPAEDAPLADEPLADEPLAS